MNTLPYLLTANLYLLLFYGCYWLLLRRNTFFGLNRAYLLLSVGLSLLLPLVELPQETAGPVQVITLPTFVVGTNAAETTGGPTSAQWFWLAYGLGVAVMLGRLVLSLRRVLRLIHRGTFEQRPGYTLVRLPTDASPSFSFGRYLVLNRTDAQSSERQTAPDALLQHEEAHIRQHHTADVLFIELVRAAFWFNPVLLLYKCALQEVHEFLADRAASVPPPDYARQLVAHALHIPSAAFSERLTLTTPFSSSSTLKQRIVMLHKPQSSRRALLGYALALPLAAVLAMCTQPDRDQPQTEAARSSQASARKPVKVEGPIFTVVEHQPEFPGGMAKLGEYLQSNLKYPARAQRANVQGRVFVRFIVTKTGEVTNVKILKGIGFGADEEATRVVQTMPNWEPATQNGQRVNVEFNLPINFALEEGVTQKAAFKAGTPPPPPPPIPANDALALNDVKQFTINGKSATKAEVVALNPNKILRVDVNKEKGTVAVTTK